MHRDKKVGLALAILLVSVVGAFFFRDDAPRGTNAPELKDAKRIDDEIRGRANEPYADADHNSRSRESRRPGGNGSRRDAAPWDMPDILQNDTSRGTAQRSRGNNSRDPFEQRTSKSPAEEPSPFSQFDDDNSPAVPIPFHNNEWDVASNDPSLGRRGTDAAAAVTSKNRTHVVAVGETLSSISGKYLGSQARYLDIYEANKDQLKSPNDLKIGMKLRVPDRNVENRSTSSTRSTILDRGTTETNPKPTKPSNPASTNNVTGNSQHSSDSTSTKKPKFKPAKNGPAIRRSVEAENLGNGKKLTQIAPQDLLEFDEGLLAELEEDAGAAAKVVAETTEPTVPRVAQVEQDSAATSVDASSK